MIECEECGLKFEPKNADEAICGDCQVDDFLGSENWEAEGHWDGPAETDAQREERKESERLHRENAGFDPDDDGDEDQDWDDEDDGSHDVCEHCGGRWCEGDCGAYP